MTGTLLRFCFAAAFSVAWTSRGAAAADSEPPAAISAAIGIKTGIIPPVLAAPELVIHFPHVFLGAFAISTPGGIGNGGTRVTVGGEVAYEISEPDRSTAYFSSALFHYEAAKDSAGLSPPAPNGTTSTGITGTRVHGTAVQYPRFPLAGKPRPG